jgi:hypothetical protein
MKLNRNRKGNLNMNLVRGVLGMTMALAFAGSSSRAQTPSAKPVADVAQPSSPALVRSYRLTYTITETDNGKPAGTQHFSMIVITGGRTVLKQGSKVPVATGTRSSAASGIETQMTYLDIGMNFDASLDESPSGVRLRTKVEQLSVAEEKSGVGLQDPIIRQTSLEGTSILTSGKPLILGSLDIPGSTRHLDVEVVMELLK